MTAYKGQCTAHRGGRFRPAKEALPKRSSSLYSVLCTLYSKRFLALLMLTVELAGVRAQDIHFSQVDADPMLLNPAYAGFFDGAGRIGLLYRNQWASISAPFQTAGLTAEAALWRSNNHQRGLSVGGSFFSDHAGTLSYGTTSGHLSVAYFTALGRYGNNFLSLGVDGGFAQSGFDPSNANMEDPTETFQQQRVSYPLLCLGLAWYYQPTSDLHTKVGLSVRNLNRPDISYSGLDNTRLEPRYSLFARAEWRGWQSLSLMPVVLVQAQGRYRELLYGADLKWYLAEGAQHQMSLRTGLAFRHGDALIANLIIEYNAFVFTFCYDANISDLVAASGGVGALEVGMVYRIAKSKRKTMRIKCPQY